MVLTAMATTSPMRAGPKRGTTLPPKLDQVDAAASLWLEPSTIVDRAHTLPSTASRVLELNEANRRQQYQMDYPMVSRFTPASVSILSLPNSDNEALNFDNR